MKKGHIVFDTTTGGWRRLPAMAERSDLLLAAGILFIIAAILIVIWWRII